MSMSHQQRAAFNQRVEGAIDEARGVLRPLFDAVEGGGVYHLPEPDAELMHEIMFRLGMLRSVIIQGDTAAQDAHVHWLALQASRRASAARIVRYDVEPNEKSGA